MCIVNRTVASRSNALLECAIDREIYLTPLHLQKLLYIDYGMCLIRGYDLIEELDFVAYQLGPVIPSLYYYYEYLGYRKIKDKILDENEDCYTLKDKTISDYTIGMYGHLTSTDLIRFTHIAKGAWYKASRKNNKWGEKIDHKDIKHEYVSYYKGSIEEYVDSWHW